MFLFYFLLYFWQKNKYFRPDRRLIDSGQRLPLLSSDFLEGQQTWRLPRSQANCLSISTVGNYAWWEGKKSWKWPAVFGLDQSCKSEGALHEFCLKEVWKPGSGACLRSLPNFTLTTVQMHKPNGSALASLESDQSPPNQVHEFAKNKGAIEHPNPSCSFWPLGTPANGLQSVCLVMFHWHILWPVGIRAKEMIFSIVNMKNLYLPMPTFKLGIFQIAFIKRK